MSTPRSTDVPVARVLGILFSTGQRSVNTVFGIPESSKELATVQNLARITVINDNKIDKVRWELDRSWLLQHGISI